VNLRFTHILRRDPLRYWTTVPTKLYIASLHFRQLQTFIQSQQMEYVLQNSKSFVFVSVPVYNYLLLAYFVTLLYRRPSDRITRLVRLSVCPVRAHKWKNEKWRRKIKIGMHVTHGTSKWSAIFQLKRSKVKVTGRKKPPKSSVMFILTGGSAGGSSAAGADCKLGLRHC